MRTPKRETSFRAESNEPLADEVVVAFAKCIFWTACSMAVVRDALQQSETVAIASNDIDQKPTTAIVAVRVPCGSDGDLVNAVDAREPSLNVDRYHRAF